jgi:hypothetical protein
MEEMIQMQVNLQLEQLEDINQLLRKVDPNYQIFFIIYNV